MFCQQCLEDYSLCCESLQIHGLEASTTSVVIFRNRIVSFQSQDCSHSVRYVFALSILAENELGRDISRPGCRNFGSGLPDPHLTILVSTNDPILRVSRQRESNIHTFLRLTVPRILSRILPNIIVPTDQPHFI